MASPHSATPANLLADLASLTSSSTMRDAGQSGPPAERYRQVFEAAGVGIGVLTPQGRWLELNSRLAHICQRSAQDLMRLSLQDITHPDDLVVDQALREATLRGQRDQYCADKRLLLPDGTAIWVQLNMVLARDDHGQAEHFVAVIEDIGERRRHQETMLTAQTDERASQAKTAFLSRMSHELRTPLNAMLGFAQLLRVDPINPLNDGQRQRVAHIEQAGARLLSMLTDVLDLSRIEAGGLPLMLEPVSVKDVIREALSMVMPHAQHHGVTLSSALPDEAAFVCADAVQWRQCLLKLLSNAILYNHRQGSVQVTVNVQRPHVIVSVQDTGLGLNADQIDHLYEPFNRLGAERSDIEGTGIGLVIVRRLIGLMHGRLEVQSTPGQGSIFQMVLPWVEDPHHIGVESGFGGLADPQAPQTLHANAHTPWRVLYAEDNPINVELVRHVMRMSPHWSLEIATSGAQAIEQALHHPPDLLLLDMHLGDMTGLDVADALARHTRTADVAKVILSADAMPEQRKAARERGFLDYLTKPLDVPRLLRLLEDLAQTTVASP